jgi:hypothetical protein
MRIRHYLETHTFLQTVLKIVVDEIRKCLVSCSSPACKPQIGAISFIQHFGNTLNYHPHFHIIAADGIFSDSDTLQFHEAMVTQDDVTDTQERIRKRVLQYFCRRGFFSKDDLLKMLSYENSGFSLDAKVKIEAWNKDGLERLIRYCSRPPFKSENVRLNGPWVRYLLPKPSHTGKTFIQLEPVEFIDRISHFIPYPRRHRRHFHGAFAPNSPLRKKIVEKAQKQREDVIKTMKQTSEKVTQASRRWAQLISRIYEVDPLICSDCGKKIKIVAFVIHTEEIRRILRGIGLPHEVFQFDSPLNHLDDICQLLPDTSDGFVEISADIFCDTVPDPPHYENFDDCSHWQSKSDPPHEDYYDPPYWEE